MIEEGDISEAEDAEVRPAFADAMFIFTFVRMSCFKKLYAVLS